MPIERATTNTQENVVELMIRALLPLAASDTGAPEVAENVRSLTSYHWSRVGDFDEPGILWLLVAAVSIMSIVYVVWFYRREREALSRFQGLLMPALRLIAVAGAIVFFLGPEKRIDLQETRDSQVMVLVDTSQSMSVEDESDSEGSKLSRVTAVGNALTESDLIASLRENHDVSVASFDVKTRTLADLSRIRTAIDDESDAESLSSSIDWQQALQAQGQETRLGNAFQHALDSASNKPLAGIILVSDGGNNSGVEPLKLADEVADRRVPILTVGVGSAKARHNLRVQQFTVPSRVYPDDRTTVRGLIHGEGFAGRTVDVELYAHASEDRESTAELIKRDQITFLTDPELVPVEFDIEPAEIGRLFLELRVAAPTDDQYSQDNHREAELEVVEAKTKVLLIASGPSRDYRFLRNQLRRDAHATVDVWLQTALPGISQDADQLLSDFPDKKEVLYEYDCIVAFDPDWTQLDAQQAELLENWVAEEAGGLIVVAGPIHTSVWAQSPEHLKIRSLYPVEFQRRLTLLDDGIYGSKTPWPIDFSREGRESEFLWLADSPEESNSLWSEFAGIFGCYAVKGPKPGARVLGRYSDPEAGYSEERPVYMAEHFYGGGRVLYLGSGELWRLRSMDLSLFEVLYTKMVRHVSQGRLLRGSSEGQLLIERERYAVGDEVVVRARLTTAGREPLLVDRVTARVVDPSGKANLLTLKADPDRAGNYLGQFNVRREGSYRILLQPPDSQDDPLSQLVQAVAPNLEFEKTRRNEELLAALASRTEGRYYNDLQTATVGSDNVPALASLIDSRAEIVTIEGAPDEQFAELVNKTLLAIICGALSCEWLLRRLLRLA